MASDTDPASNPDDAAPAVVAAQAPAPGRRRLGRWLGGAAGVLVLLAVLLIGALFWALQSAPGTAWLLGRVPYLSVLAPRGSLLGDFAADRLDVTLPGSGVLRLDAPRWQALAATRGDRGRWLHLVLASLHADRVTWLPSSEPKPASGEPNRPPKSLRLPIELEIGAASVDELRIGSAEATPVRDLRARVHLGADGGALHRLDALAARIEQAAASGGVAIGADAPFTVVARLQADSIGLAPAWQAKLDADGPLEALPVTASARVPASSSHAAQALDAQAVVRPFAAWPLGELRASAEALDLSAFAAAAPATALSGRAVATTSGSSVPAVVSLDLDNARAGRWNEGLLPVTRLRGELRARPDDPNALQVQSLTAELGSAKLPGGRLEARGAWTPARWNVEADLHQLRPVALDARAPETSLDGKVTATGSGFAATGSGGAAASAADARSVDLEAQLAGLLADPRLPRAAPRNARLRLEAHATPNDIELRSAEARLGDAVASLAGRLQRSAAEAPWRASGKLKLAGFDPAPWWPGSGESPLARGPNRIDAGGDFDLVLPAAPAADATLYALAAATRGQATLVLADSTLAGVAVAGEARFANADGRARPKLQLVAGGNRAQAEGTLAAAGASGDDWQLQIDAPRLDALAPLLGPPLPAAGSSPARPPASAALPALAGALTVKAHAAGRWPALTSDGELQGAALRYRDITVRQASGRWRLGSSGDAALDGRLAADGIALSGRNVEHAEATLSGTGRAHRAELRIASAALPPEWIDALAARLPADAATVTAAATAAAAAPAESAASTPVSASTAAAPSATPPPRSQLVLSAEGGLVDAGGEPSAGWRGRVRELSARSLGAPERAWVSARDVRGSFFWAGGPMRANLEPGAATALGATLRWSRVAWQEAAAGTPARLDVQASLDAFAVAPALRAIQPGFGWGGDLSVGARIDVRSAPSVHVDAVVERRSGDLTVTDEIGTQPLGFTDLRLGAAADGGVWSFTAGLAGRALGVVSAAVTARTAASAAWPAPETPIEGVAELRVANLGTWGTWVPAGWRLAGELHANAAIGGRFGAPTYTGRVDGSELGVRNFVEGVNVTDGRVAIDLQGTTARIERFDAKGGDGTVKLEGEATFDGAPVARLQLTASRFELLGRIDRRIVASGDAALRLDAKTLALDGTFKVDEGLVDFTRSDAPKLGDDVVVVRRPKVAAPADGTVAAASLPASAPALPAVQPATRTTALDLRVGMGEKLHVRGRGLDAGLRGELRITSPAGRLAVNGTLSTFGGTYQAYGQKLGIDRGVLAFAGPVENPRLDIEATRPDLDVRVGVVVSGTALAPRVRLFSEPDMSDIDKLSWLVLGRASETTGGADTALLQQAALALLSGEGPGVTDRLIQSIGLDTVDVRQSQQGAVKDTIVSLGKQISARWYVGFERGLNTTTGTWQLIYRLARRVTVKAEAGSDNAVDINWTLRWK